jgi:hypothetical protein
VQILHSPTYVFHLMKFFRIAGDMYYMPVVIPRSGLHLNITWVLSSQQAFLELYSQILDHGGHAFGDILRHVRDDPKGGCIFHCTAGKDRTGIMAAILLEVRSPTSPFA